ncbi:hypothetical protein [Pseudomonas gingeri]|uniref:Uncharacterized protein n=1 Tax=Pseudomonas gingeri TaxID=117681 RepID=A0A7Y7WE61_9PSED|nr:hypothetical protein [Pseudomonas gingeri]NWB47526.1 hypothetical protein [Pseudomonas gingeri]
MDIHVFFSNENADFLGPALAPEQGLIGKATNGQALQRTDFCPSLFYISLTT